jgi:hypothetical protein
VKERKDRVDDALNATRAAVEEGIVPGGGVALLRAKKVLEALKSDNPDIQAGINLVAKAIEAPIRQIVENAGVEGSIVVGKVLEKTGNFGFDAADRRVRRHGQEGHHRPDQGRAHRASGRSLGRLAADHHRSHGGGASEEGQPSPPWAAAAAWAAWAAWTSDPATLTHSTEGLARRRGPLFLLLFSPFVTPAKAGVP